MLRWILGGRSSQGPAESATLCSGEEQPKNPFTELQVLKGHYDIIRFLIQIDDFRFASAGDDGAVLVWNVETGERLLELRAHTQQITALTKYRVHRGSTTHPALISASSDRMLCVWDADTGGRLHTLSDLQAPVKCLLVLNHLDLWFSGGHELCLWNRDLQLQCNSASHRDAGISCLVNLPQNCVAAAVDREIVIYKLNLSEETKSISAVRHLTDHQDTVRALISVNDGLFASGSHMGEVILWDSVDWTLQVYEHVLWEEPAAECQSDLSLSNHRQGELCVQHLHSDGQLLVAAVGGGLYVYDVVMKTAVAYRKLAHDSVILHTMLLPNGTVMSCSDDGSVRIWELQDLPLTAEPASTGFFGLFGTFGKSSKTGGAPAKKLQEVSSLRTLELIGDLIGHSGAVQMFLSFADRRVVTCSADHLLIVWKDGERESQLRNLAVFQKLEENLCL